MALENFTARLAEANLGSKSHVANFVKKRCLDEKLKDLNRNITSNKKKHVLIENELNELLEKVKAVSTKKLTKDLRNELVLFIEKNIILQQSFKIIWCLCKLKNTFNVLMALLRLIRGNLMECQKKILKT